MRRTAAGVALLGLLGLLVAAAGPARAGGSPAGVAEGALLQVGYSDPAVRLSRSAGEGMVRQHVTVEVGAFDITRPPEPADAEQVAGVVWATLPSRIDTLEITVVSPAGSVLQAYDAAGLAERFGPRLPELDVLAPAEDGTGPRNPMRNPIVVLLAVFLLTTGLALAAARAARTARRRSRRPS
jgi:hypothetical protein